MTTFENLTTSQKARAALHRDGRAICSETCHFLGLEVTKPAMEIISELLYKKLAIYGADLEAFAKHAKRATINSEDVKLLARRNPSLKAHLNKIANPVATKDKRRKTALPVTKPDTPTTKPKDDTNKQKETSIKTNEVSSVVCDTTELGPNDDGMSPEKKSDDKMIVDDTIDLTFD